MARYQAVDSSLTLEEGLQEYRERNAEHLRDRNMSVESQAFFLSHDIAHVVFACDISLINEAVVKTWTAFGTTLGFWKHIAAYSREETNEIVKEISISDILVTGFRSITILPRVVFRCRAMNRPWPWVDYEEFLSRELVDIRHEFNIKPVIIE